MEDDSRQRYRAIRLRLTAGTPVTMLHVGEQRTLVVTGTNSEPDQVLALAIGAHRTAAEFFRHTPPLPGELEDAIQHVEDEINRARQAVAGYPMLVTADAAIGQIARIAGGGKDTAPLLSIEQVEQVFALLAGHALGRPASSAGIPGGPAFAATLLILREFMHHLKFSAITLVD